MDSLLLDIGGDIGALIIHTGSELGEVELEISPGAGSATRRSHNVVHARQGRQGISYSAVFPSVPAGEYTVWRHDDTPAARVRIRGGEVTEYRWDGAV